MPKPLLLVVEDEPVSRELLTGTLTDHGYEVLLASTGAQAWSLIETHAQRLDAILLDRILPDLDSLVLLRRLKADMPNTYLPVIMQTSLSSEHEISEGLKAGAFYYLTKPFPGETLLAIVRAAVDDRHNFFQLQDRFTQVHGIINHIEHAEFWFRTLNDARDLALLTAQVAPDPARVVPGLTELMLNAVEHGNLAISYAEKTRFIEENRLDTEVAHRLGLSQFADRRGRLRVSRTDEAVTYTIRDEGDGFDWRPFVEISPSRAFDTHGRGIAISRMLSFDSLTYVGSGSEVVASVNLASTGST